MHNTIVVAAPGDVDTDRDDTEHLGLIGLAIVLAAMTRWFWRAWAVNVPKSPYVFQALVAAGLLCGAVTLYQGYDDPYAPWAIGVALVFLFLTATGGQRLGGSMVELGDAIPAFTAADDSDATFDSASLARSSPKLTITNEFGYRNRNLNNFKTPGGPGLPVPTSLLIDTDDRVVWKDQSE